MQRQALEGCLLQEQQQQQWQVHSVQVGLHYRGEITVSLGLKQVVGVARLLLDEVSHIVKPVNSEAFSEGLKFFCFQTGPCHRCPFLFFFTTLLFLPASCDV